jgi:CTP synthase
VDLKKLNLPKKAAPDLKNWNVFLHRLKNPKHTVNIGLIGKYVELQDSYKSILEAFIHAGAANETKVNVVSVHSEYIDADNVAEKMQGLDGILVAPGFGERGIEGKIEAVRFARENNLPFFGICY